MSLPDGEIDFNAPGKTENEFFRIYADDGNAYTYSASVFKEKNNQEFRGFVNKYMQTFGLTLSTAGAYGGHLFKRGTYTQTNRKTGSFKGKSWKLSANASGNLNRALDLKRLSTIGNIVAGTAIAYDILDDGNVKSSTIVNASLLVVSLAFPPTALFILGYGAADFIFDFSGMIDNKYGEFNTHIYD